MREGLLIPVEAEQMMAHELQRIPEANANQIRRILSICPRGKFVEKEEYDQAWEKADSLQAQVDRLVEKAE